jgi:hypothetical protein
LMIGLPCLLAALMCFTERSSRRLEDDDTDIKDANNNMKDTLCSECCICGAGRYLSATVSNSPPPFGWLVRRCEDMCCCHGQVCRLQASYIKVGVAALVAIRTLQLDIDMLRCF